MRDLIDFVFSINVAARQGAGEDSWCHAFARDLGMIAAFDGCGGSGSRTHEVYTGHTEAYVASRLCAGAFYDGFCDAVSAAGPAGADAESILDRAAGYCSECLSAYRPPKGMSAIRTSMITTLPTTAAVLIMKKTGGAVEMTSAWAGDSRVYLLTPEGLAQISVDDADTDDPFDTDGMMNNTLNADRAPEIRTLRFRVPTPFVAFTATDGCFAYYLSPMEFEGILLSTLLSSYSPADWERSLSAKFGSVSGDDYTMVTSSVGFGSYDALKNAFAGRYKRLYDDYLSPISALGPDDIGSRRELWENYRGPYTRFIKE